MFTPQCVATHCITHYLNFYMVLRIALYEFLYYLWPPFHRLFVKFHFSARLVVET